MKWEIYLYIVSKISKSDYSKPHNSLQVRFLNILAHSILLIEAFLETCHMFAFRFWEVFVNGYVHYITRDSLTQVHILAVFVKKGLSFASDTSRKNFGNFWPPLSQLLEPYLNNVNHCIIINFDQRVTGSLVTRLVP